jgi:hypothetical protein
VRKVRLVSSMGLGEFAFEEERDGVDAVVPELGEAGQSELAEHAGCDVVGGRASVTAEQQVERAAHPANAEAVAVEQQVPGAGEPLQGDEVESLAEPEGGVGRAFAVGVIGLVVLLAQVLLEGP